MPRFLYHNDGDLDMTDDGDDENDEDDDHEDDDDDDDDDNDDEDDDDDYLKNKYTIKMNPRIRIMVLNNKVLNDDNE